MSVASVTSVLDDAVMALQEWFPYTWRYSPRKLRRPLSANVNPDWPSFKMGDKGPWVKNQANWLHAELTFPKTWRGHRLEGTEALMFMHGFSPFTLWVDGHEVLAEQKAWFATGPIADPFPVTIEPGRVHRLVMKVVPTELPNRTLEVNLMILSRSCLETMVKLAATSGQLKLAESLATGAAERRVVERAASCIDAEQVRRQNWATVLQQVDELEQHLEAFRDQAKKLSVTLCGHAHIDMDWKWTWPDTVDCIRRDVKAVTDLMDDHPEVTFTHSQVPTYEVIRKQEPELFDRVCKRIDDGRWEPVAGTWVEGDLHMARGEAVARHMLYARQYSQKYLGGPARVMWEPDTFGHPGNMPQIARLGGLEAYFHMRGNPGTMEQWPIRLWEGIDGTTIPTFSVNYNNLLQPDRLFRNIMLHRATGQDRMLHMWGIGDHGGGLPRIQLEFLDMYRDKPVVPTIRFGTVGGLLDEVMTSRPELPTSRGETHTIFEGCFTTHARMKQLNRQCESALLSAESLSVMAGLDSTERLREGWTDTLFNHFHDIMDGAAVHDAYIDAYARAESSLEAADKVTAEAIGKLKKKGRQSDVLTLVNPLGFARTEPVEVELPKKVVGLEDETGRVVPVQRMGDVAVFVARDVPALGTRSWRLVTDAKRLPELLPVTVERGGKRGAMWVVTTRGGTLQVFPESGIIGSWFDESTCRRPDPTDPTWAEAPRDIVAGGAAWKWDMPYDTRADLGLAALQLIDERPNQMAAWVQRDFLNEQTLAEGAEVEVLETGPVFARLRAVHKVRSSTVVKDVVIYNELRRVDVTLDIDWHEVGDDRAGVPALKLSFGTAAQRAAARADGPFVVAERPADGREQPTQTFVDVSGPGLGLAVFNDAKYGYDALGGRLRMTLLRNAYAPDPETDNGRHRYRFAMVPHDGSMGAGDLVRGGMAFNHPMEAVRSAVQAPKVSVELTGPAADRVVVTGVKRAEEDGRVLVRLFETTGRAGTVSLEFGRPLKRAEEVNLVEQTLSRLTGTDGTVKVKLRPYEVKTVGVGRSKD